MMSHAQQVESAALRAFTGSVIAQSDVENVLRAGKVVLEVIPHWAPESAHKFYAFPQGTDGSKVAFELTKGWKYLPKVQELTLHAREVQPGVNLATAGSLLD